MIRRFGAFELDEERFELRRDGVVEPLQPRVFDLLRALARRPDVVVSRAELLAEVWAGASVTNDALAQAVMALRKALGDPGEPPRFVETVRGRGYRFIAPVTTSEPSANTGAARSAGGAPGARAPEGPPFVGRGERVAQVEALLVRGGGVVMVTSDAGGGKTRFLDALAARAEGSLVVRTAPAGAPDLWLFTQALRELARRGVLLDGAASALAEGSFDAGKLDEPAARFALADELLRVLVGASAGRPLLLAVDDLHAETARTLAVLELLAPRLRETSVVLCAAYMQSTPLNAGLQALLAVLSRDPGVVVFRLEPFTRDDVGTFLEATSGVAPSAELLARIHHKTAGNARLLMQLAQRPSADWLREPDVRTGSLVDVTPLHEAIAYQLGSLSSDVAAVVTMAAVLGPSFTVAPLSAALGLANAETLRALDVAAAARVLTRNSAGHYRFAYPLVRDVLHARLPAVERARLHGLAARALEAHLGDSDDHLRVAEIASHFVEAAAAGDVEAAVDWSLRAATLAAAAGDDAAARATASRGLEAIELAAQPDAAKRARLRAFGQGG
jgi:DNA-binding winged helix-turn-helix (wHTH) protein